MSDRINYITVILREDRRDHDCSNTLTAIRSINGVLSAEPNIASIQDFMAEERAKDSLKAILGSI